MIDASPVASGSRLRRVRDADSAVVALYGSAGTCLLATFALFVLNSPYAIVPLAGFLAVTGYGWYAAQAETARGLTFLATASTIVVLALITVYVFLEAMPVLGLMGVRLFGFTDPVEVFGIRLAPSVDAYWSTSEHVYSLVPMIWGTFVTTLIATLIAAPLGVAAALFLAEIAPPLVRESVKPGVEILAGIPSIVYGYLGFVTLNSYRNELSVTNPR